MLFLNNISYCDAAEAWQLGLQDPATPVMEGIISFHNHLMFFIVLIAMFVSPCLFVYGPFGSNWRQWSDIATFSGRLLASSEGSRI